MRSQLPFCYTCRDGSQLLSHRLNKLLGDVVISQGGVVPFINPELLPSKSKWVILSTSPFFLIQYPIGLARRRVQAKKSNCALDILILLFCVVATITFTCILLHVCVSFCHAHGSSQSSSSTSLSRPTCDTVTKPGLPGRNVDQSGGGCVCENGPCHSNDFIQRSACYVCSMPKLGISTRTFEGPQNRWASREKILEPVPSLAQQKQFSQEWE